MAGFRWLMIVTFVLTAQTGFARGLKRWIIKGGDQAQIEKQFKANGKLHRRLRYEKGLVASATSEEIDSLEQEFPNLSAEEDAEVHLFGFSQTPPEHAKGRPGGSPPPQPAQSIPWGIAATHSTQAHQLSRGAGTKVCIVDTGIQTDHPDLAGQVVGGENFVVIKGKLNPQAYKDDNGHGTHVAGTVAALDNSIGVVGVAPEAKLLAVKVLNRQGSGYTSDVADGVRSCVELGADVISMSLGSASGSSTLHSAIQFAASAGAVVVAAAGNESGPVGYPAAYPEVVAVSAVDSNLDFASFSNSGPEVDFAAPGVGVLSTTKGSAYATYSGTSMATPHVSGIFALAVASGSNGPVAVDIGLSSSQQGEGFLDALLTVGNQ